MGDDEVQQGVAQELEPLVVVLRGTAVGERSLEQLGNLKPIVEPLFGPTKSSV